MEPQSEGLEDVFGSVYIYIYIHVYVIDIYIYTVYIRITYDIIVQDIVKLQRTNMKDRFMVFLSRC